MCAFRRERGISLIEVLVTLTILALALVPTVRVFTTSHRIGHSARRLVDVVIHVQSLVEALAELDPNDFPQIAPGQETGLLSDDGIKQSGSSEKYQAVLDFFARPSPIKDMKRTIFAKRLKTGEVEVRIEVEWSAIHGEVRTRQKLVLPMLSTPRNWQ